MASVDVIVPCYNYGRFLRDCVGSVLSQEGVAVRVLIIDDCSSDDSEQVGRELAADPRVEYRRHAVNRGHVATYNEGLDWLASEYCLLLSADDMLTPGALARAVSVMDAQPQVVLTHGRAIWTPDPHAEAHRLDTGPGVTIQTGSEFVRSRCDAGHNLVECPTAIGRTAVQKRVGGYRLELPHTCDMEMWLRYAVHGSVAELAAHQAYYRTHGMNMSTGYAGTRDLAHVRLTFDLFFEHHRAHFPDAPRLRRLAYKGIADRAFAAASKAFLAGQAEATAEWTRLGREVDPGARFSARWVRLGCKRVLGPRVWRAVSACHRWVRPRRGAQARAGVPS